MMVAKTKMCFKHIKKHSGKIKESYKNKEGQLEINFKHWRYAWFFTFTAARHQPIVAFKLQKSKDLEVITCWFGIFQLTSNLLQSITTAHTLKVQNVMYAINHFRWDLFSIFWILVSFHLKILKVYVISFVLTQISGIFIQQHWVFSINWVLHKY